MPFSSMRKPTTCVSAFLRVTITNRLTRINPIARAMLARVGNRLVTTRGRMTA